LEHKGISISFGKSQHILIKDYGFITLLLHLVYTVGAKALPYGRIFLKINKEFMMKTTLRFLLMPKAWQNERYKRNLT
jgi:hypothetical protein